MPNLFEGLITRADIANIAVNEQLILDDDRVSVLDAIRSIDVQACPGSGKTTLIATKLILLAKIWPFQHQGVCVLSHTNVAKDEIIDRLKRSNTIEAQCLLNYPHFIGTIQEFVNRFLALPFIRSNGVRDIIIDNDEYVKMAEKLLGLVRFVWFRGTLNGLGDRDAQAAFLRGTFRFISQDGEAIYINKRPRAWQQEVNYQRAIRDLGTLKQYLDERGFFLFRDMYFLAQTACSRNPELRQSLSKRFPYVFLDEMQDTQKFQDELLNEIFPLDEPSL
ncbi:UvrD-helicase domain-containing protein, partial [bacterium]|nr:UvrD-helicase domain-containing protein [bacterium]